MGKITEITGEEGWISLGPWGGEDGVYSTYRSDGPIMQITVHYESVIDSILFESKSHDGSIIGSPVKIGGIGGWPAKFCIDSSVEQFSSVSLTYGDHNGDVVITSLCFYTNLRTYGPFGPGGGHSMYIPIEGGVIVGFHGLGGSSLNAIGIFLAPRLNSFPDSEKIVDRLHSIQDPDYAPSQLKGKIICEEGCISLGPWGGKGGASSMYKLDGPVMQITIRYGNVIDSILFESKSSDGIILGSSVKIGGTGGGCSETFCIDSSVEQFLSISLTYKDDGGGVLLVTSLCFVTNLKMHGPFGWREGHSAVSIPIEGKVVGFHGRGGLYLDAIGIFVAPKLHSYSIQDLDFVPTQLKGKIIGEEGRISLGPWGGKGGGYSTYKFEGPIMQITVHYGLALISSILFESKSRDDVIGSSVKIGGTVVVEKSSSDQSIKFCIDSSVEQFSSISMTFQNFNGDAVVSSLCLSTNLKKYGPFGRERGLRVDIPIEGEVVGFHGRGGWFLDAIGIIVAPKLHSSSIQHLNYTPTQLKRMISDEEAWISLGPWGGKEGVDWAYKPNEAIMQMSICYGEAINSILFRNRSSDGFLIESASKMIGNTGGHMTKTFCIDSSVERLSSICMTFGDYHGQLVITSLSFETRGLETNIEKKHGPFGQRSGASSVSIPIEAGVIAGFHGRVGSYVTAIGVVVASKVKNLPSSEKNFDSLYSVQALENASQLKDKISSEERWTALGPWGGEYGEYWEYKVIGPIMQISIGYGEYINSILCESKSHDRSVIGSCEKIANIDGHVIETFCINTLEEQLTSIDLTYDCFDGKGRITTLCFDTNLNKYGPFGSGSGHYRQSIPIESGVFGGFYGRVDERCITAIGIFVASSSQDPKTQLEVQVIGSEVGSKPKTFETPTIKSTWSLRSLGPKLRANFCGTKPKTLENIIPNNSSSSVTTNEDDHHSGAPSVSSSSATTNNDDHHGALSPTSQRIHSDLNLLDTTFEEVGESRRHMNVKINQAHEKFKELQILQSSERDSDKLQKAESDKKELQKAISKLKVQIHSHNKVRSGDSNPHQKKWDNINNVEDGMTHFFHEEKQTGHFDERIFTDFEHLPVPLQGCLLCFFKFPPKAIIKRTPMIYLWIGQGYIHKYLDLQPKGYVRDVEVHHAGKIFDELIEKGFFEPIYHYYSLVPDSCRMSCSVRSSLYEEAKRRGFTSNGSLDLEPTSTCGGLIRDSSCLINVGEAIIDFQPKVLKNMNHIRSLYLGRWQSSAEHHIELENAKILYGFYQLNNLTFLSLRGISMIMELPTSILHINDLMILDLRSCHNLEVIPDKIGMLKSLTILDMSECYYVENMPKSLSQLSNLQILKGFLIGDFTYNKNSCTLQDLSGLQKLRKLNIHISAKNFLKDLEYLENFDGLEKLTISWGRLQGQAEVINEAFHCATVPPKLQKLHLQCFPTTSLANWLKPSKLKELKKLYIRGGQLHDLGEYQKHQREQWIVEILRFEYLGGLELYWKQLRTIFPKLIYLRQEGCPMFIDFPCDKNGVWINERAINSHGQLHKYCKYYRSTNGMISSSSMLSSGSSFNLS